jgi:hypothetical protein
MLEAKKTPEEIIRALYVRSLARQPTAEETASLIKIVEADKDRMAALEDIFWSLLNSREFAFNH